MYGIFYPSGFLFGHSFRLEHSVWQKYFEKLSINNILNNLKASKRAKLLQNRANIDSKRSSKKIGELQNNVFKAVFNFFIKSVLLFRLLISYGLNGIIYETHTYVRSLKDYYIIHDFCSFLSLFLSDGKFDIYLNMFK